MYSYKPMVYKIELSNRLREFYGKDVSQLSAEDVLYFFYGNNEERDERDCDYAVTDKRYTPHKTNIFQRLAWLVVIPVVLLSLPFVWIATGEWGYSPNWKISKLLHKITGL